jgi:predicted hydrocarbon binding protein
LSDAKLVLLKTLDARPVWFRTLDKDVETGLIVESISGEKIVTFRTKTFLQLMDRLVELLGEGLSANLLYQMGMDVGRSMFGYAKDEVKSDSDLVSVMDIAMSERGWGRCTEIKKVEMRGVTYRIKTESNPVSGKHGPNEPMCHFIRGNYVGFLASYLNKKAKHSEQITCAALGAPYCTFEITLE